jgi:hypothetical protein
VDGSEEQDSSHIGRNIIVEIKDETEQVKLHHTPDFVF